MLANALSPLTDIINSITVLSGNINETDIDELRESIYLIIDDFINNNIQEYKYKDFNHRLFEHTYDIFENLYENIEQDININ